jgi:hypothetical protein
VSTPKTLARCSVGEWMLTSERAYGNPFTDVTVKATFRGPEGREVSIPGFYDGENWSVVR